MFNGVLGCWRGNPHGDAASSTTAPGQVAAYLESGGHNGAGFGPSGKRRVVYAADSATSGCTPSCRGITKRPRLDDWGRVVGYHGQGGCDFDYATAVDPVAEAAAAAAARGPTPLDRNGSIHVKNLAFLVIREREPSPPPTPTPPPPPMSPEPRIGIHPPPHPPGVASHGPAAPPLIGGPAPMERTVSGISISSDTSTVQSPCDDEGDASLLSDLAAANLVRRHVASIRYRHRDSQHGRILKSLINPKSRGADFPLDNDALRSIFSAANELFFANRLSQRVKWDWSHPASAQYESHIVGTTALRRSARLGGYETLIVLSSPILKDTKYNRRLLISTFLHEMIHSFLFITCGFKARQCGGHTEGFRQVAEIMDEWVGKENLRLRDMEADLERFIEDDFIQDPMPHLNSHSNNHYGGSSGSKNEAAWRGPERRYQEPNYPTIQAPQPYRGHPGEWEWHDREGFRAPGVHPGGSTSYYP
ncbi:hypothetical protein PT974_06155 [Cladobotryum mycophilum]|uniref:SprT-like domain-containing protein n=1 Tax=Cladobotryum mycophilum TaxID=491253 RepID=A0ABR0SKQ3_9HYPO